MQNTILQDIYTPQLGGFSVFLGGGGGGGGVGSDGRVYHKEDSIL